MTMQGWLFSVLRMSERRADTIHDRHKRRVAKASAEAMQRRDYNNNNPNATTNLGGRETGG